LEGERRPFRELELHKHSAGLVYTTINVASEVFARSELVLAARAEVEPRRMRDEFPRQTVLGPVEEFDDLWYSRIAGVPLQWRERAPRVLPFMDGFSFYDLDRNNPYWQRVMRSESLALGIDGEWPSIQIRLFALLPEA
jgi:type VI secretion system protein ImpJ